MEIFESEIVEPLIPLVGSWVAMLDLLIKIAEANGIKETQDAITSRRVLQLWMMATYKNVQESKSSEEVL